MTMRPPRRVFASFGLAALLVGSLTACRRGDSSSGNTSARKATTIQNIGSDTMVNLAQAWAEEYSLVDPGVSVEVSGGGSGVGVAALINGTADIANCSRKLEHDEVEKAKASGHDPKEFLVGYDGLAIFVHKDNPIEEITLEQLAGIFRENGTINKWSDLGVNNIPGSKSDKIILISRQNNSGTYHYFREVVVGKKHDFKLGSMDMNGSKDVVELVSKTPGALGYSGLGYATSQVKVVKVAKKPGDVSVMPSNATIMDRSYPIARPMFMYTPSGPQPHIKKYLDWILSPAGQKIVEQTGYVPLQK
ncbi:MAG TPA: PstS family phosphate ABC transporter substrate-binding protein [Polyangia bacterium]